MKTMLAKLDPRIIYVLLTLGALAAAAGAPVGFNGWSIP
jgi:hypothetical protein